MTIREFTNLLVRYFKPESIGIRVAVDDDGKPDTFDYSDDINTVTIVVQANNATYIIPDKFPGKGISTEIMAGRFFVEVE